MKKILLLASFAISALTAAVAQNKISIEDVKKAQLRNSGEILDGEELKGYFVFYVSDKVDKKTNEYTVRIMDNNLNTVKEIVFEDDKNVQILESSYNGNSIMFLFYNRKEKTIEYRSYGFDGKQKSTYSKELTKRSQAFFEMSYTKNEEGQNEGLFSVGKSGYVTVFPLKEGKYYTYEVNFFFTDRNKQWTFEASEEQEDKWAKAEYLGATDSLVVFEVVKQKKLMSNTSHSWLLGLNIFTGKKEFEISTEGEDYKFYPMGLSTIRGKSEFLLLGTYFSPDARVLKDASLGLAAWTMNSAGKAVAKKYNSWDGDIGKYVASDKRGRIDQLGYVYFHRLLQTEDGKFFAIGEGYKKAVSALGVASKVLGAFNGGGGLGVSAYKIKITDMVVFQFNEKFEIKGATIYDKFSNDIELETGYEVLSPHTMALLAKAFGGFDYDFTQTDKDHTRFTVGYSDYERSGENRGTTTFNAVTYADGKTTTDKISLQSKAKWLRVFPAKPGSVTILEYFKKDKRLEMRMEKIN